MEYGEKIEALRKARGMTQRELGAELNVTFQAVSKWERGESIPDFPTLCRIAKLFEVSVDYFNEDAEYETETEEVFVEETPAPVMLGVCKHCGRVVNEGEEFSVSPVLVCKACHVREEEAARQAEAARREAERKNAEARALAEKARQRDAELQEINRKNRIKHVRNKGLILAGIICGVLILFVIIGLVLNPTDIGDTLLGLAVVLVFLFPFVAQLTWGGTVRNVCLAGGKVIGTPGVIFSLDLDGIIFLIVIKLLFAVLKFVIFLLTVLICAVAAMLISPFTFVPRLLAVCHGNLDPD